MYSGRMKRRIAYSALSGFAITLLLWLLLACKMRFFPYSDKPMMPPVFLLNALGFGIFAAEAVSVRWLSTVVFLLVNSVCYGLSIFAIGEIVRFVRAADTVSSPQD